MKVAVGINYYDDLHGLLYSFEAKPGFYDKVDKIYLIDGRYKDRDDMPEYNPAEMDYISGKYRKVHYVQMFNRTQIEKRNRYIEMAEKDDMDFLIVLDSDEWLHIRDIGVLHRVLDRPEQCFPIMQTHEVIGTQPRPRLFKKPFDFRHRENKSGISHGSLYSEYGKGNIEIINQMYAWYKDHDKGTGIPGFEMFHDKQFRSKKRVIADRIYYDENPNR